MPYGPGSVVHHQCLHCNAEVLISKRITSYYCNHCKTETKLSESMVKELEDMFKE